MKHTLTILFLLTIAAGCAAQQPAPAAETAMATQPAIGFEALTTFDRLPLLVDWKSYQDSSYSREHKNADAGNYLRIDNQGDKEREERVLVDTDGPGVIYRFWSTGATGNYHSHPEIRFNFYFDGEAAPRISLTMRELFGEHGSKWPFVPPLSRTFQSGFIGLLEGPASICYVPIPFARHIKITSNAAQFYHVDYIRYPEGTKIESFSQELAEKNRAVLEEAAKMFVARGQMPTPPSRPMETTEGPIEVAPGATAVLYEGAGPAVIRELGVKLASPSQENLRGLVLQIQYEGSGLDSVNAPIGDFFGAAGGDLRYRSMPMGCTDNGYYCYFPMPYRKSVKVLLRNDTAEAARLDRTVKVLRVAALPNEAGYFHAAFHTDPKTADRVDYNILDVEGAAGKFVGCNILMQCSQGLAGMYFLEGDEAIYVDDETKWPSRWVGTGTEDYFNGSYYWNSVQPEDKDQPFGGMTLRDDWLHRVCAYRWHITDFISFTKRIRVDIQHGPESDFPTDYSSVGYYYLSKPTAATKLPEMAKRRVRNEILGGPLMMGCEFVGPFTSDGKEVPAISQPGSPGDPGNEIMIGFGPPYRQYLCKVTKVGQEIAGKLRVGGDGLYRMRLFLATGPNYGKYGVFIDDRLIGIVNTHAPSYHPAVMFDLGEHNLQGGDRKLSFQSIAAGEGSKEMDLGIVTMQMSPLSATLISKWAIIGTWPCPKDGGWETANSPETGEINLDAPCETTFPGPDGKPVAKKVEWQKISLPPGAGVPADRYFGAAEWRVCYGVTYIWSPDDRNVGAFIAKDDALKMWVNRQLVFDKKTWSHYLSDQHIALCPLKKGWNTLLVKCGNWNGNWAWAIRISNPGDDLKFTNETPDELKAKPAGQ